MQAFEGIADRDDSNYVKLSQTSVRVMKQHEVEHASGSQLSRK